MHVGDIIKKEQTNVWHGRMINMLFYEPAVYKRGYKMKKVFMGVGNIATWLFTGNIGPILLSRRHFWAKLK